MSIKTKKTTEFLKCILTEEEKRERAEKMALLVSQINDSEAQLKSVQTQIKSEIAKCEADMATCSEQYRSGYEMRRVECEEEHDFIERTVTLIRQDTGEIVKTRVMTPEERQEEMQFA